MRSLPLSLCRILIESRPDTLLSWSGQRRTAKRLRSSWERLKRCGVASRASRTHGLALELFSTSFAFPADVGARSWPAGGAENRHADSPQSWPSGEEGRESGWRALVRSQGWDSRLHLRQSSEAAQVPPQGVQAQAHAEQGHPRHGTPTAGLFADVSVEEERVLASGQQRPAAGKGPRSGVRRARSCLSRPAAQEWDDLPGIGQAEVPSLDLGAESDSASQQSEKCDGGEERGRRASEAATACAHPRLPSLAGWSRGCCSERPASSRWCTAASAGSWRTPRRARGSARSPSCSR